MTFLDWMKIHYPNGKDPATVWLVCTEAQKYADFLAAGVVQNVIDYELERGHRAISLDSRRAEEYVEIYKNQ